MSAPAVESVLVLWLDEDTIETGVDCPHCGMATAIRVAEYAASITPSHVTASHFMGFQVMCQRHPGSWGE